MAFRDMHDFMNSRSTAYKSHSTAYIIQDRMVLIWAFNYPQPSLHFTWGWRIKKEQVAATKTKLKNALNTESSVAVCCLYGKVVEVIIGFDHA